MTMPKASPMDFVRMEVALWRIAEDSIQRGDISDVSPAYFAGCHFNAAFGWTRSDSRSGQACQPETQFRRALLPEGVRGMLGRH